MGHYRELHKNDWTNRDADLDEDSDGPKELCIRYGCRLPKGKGQFSGLSGPFKSIGNFCIGRLLQRYCRILCKSPITSCSSRNHSVCRQEQIVFWKFLGARDVAYQPWRGGGIAQRRCSVISTIVLLKRLYGLAAVDHSYCFCKQAICLQ